MRYNRLGSVAQLDVDTLGRAQELPGEGGGGRGEPLRNILRLAIESARSNDLALAHKLYHGDSLALIIMQKRF